MSDIFEKQLAECRRAIAFYYVTKLAAYSLVGFLIGIAHGVAIGVVTTITLYLIAGHLERKIYGYKRAINMLKMLQAFKDLPDVSKGEKDE
jgi:hypothetical protein